MSNATLMSRMIREIAWASEAIAEIGENINIRRFVRYEMGEGLEKKNDDFVAEVMAEVNKK